MRARIGSALGVLVLGIVMALALGEGVVRLAAWWSPAIQELVAPRSRLGSPAAATLAAYLALHPGDVIPHRDWFNYWNNALGLNDEEFVVPKPSGRFRILALGDSFTYGVVPYPKAVMTILEMRLRDSCPGQDLDVLNFGFSGAGIRDYEAIVKLGLATYDPDLVLVNFYAGNDGPDLYRFTHERTRARRVLALLDAMRLWTLARNAFRLWQGVQDLGLGTTPPVRPAGRGEVPRGGTLVDPSRHISDRAPAMTGPVFTKTAFVGVQAQELRRIYRPEDPAVADRAWRSALAHLETIRTEVVRPGRRMALAIYPSSLQVYPAQRAALVETLRGRTRYATLSLDAVDPWLPNRQLAAYCQRAALPCVDLTPVFVEASQVSADPLYKERDTHWTIRGNRVAAEAEARFLAGLVCHSGSRAPAPLASPRP